MSLNSSAVCVDDSTLHTKLSLTKSSPHSYVRYGHEHEPGSARAIKYCALTIPFEATSLLSHIGDSLGLVALVESLKAICLASNLSLLGMD